MATQTTTYKSNPLTAWGNDSPEKLKRDGAPAKLSWKDQVKGLMNPADQLRGMGAGAFMDSFLNREQSDRPQQHPEEKTRPKRNETILFSHEKRAGEKKIEQETNMLLDQLKSQITQLEKSQKNLTSGLSKVKVEQMPKEKLGIYFLRYLEWLLAEVRRMRVKIEEGSAWLQEFTNKKKKKQGYWQKAKTHGTSFTLNNERTLATQTG